MQLDVFAHIIQPYCVCASTGFSPGVFQGFCYAVCNVHQTKWWKSFRWWWLFTYQYMLSESENSIYITRTSYDVILCY